MRMRDQLIVIIAVTFATVAVAANVFAQIRAEDRRDENERVAAAASWAQPLLPTTTIASTTTQPAPTTIASMTTQPAEEPSTAGATEPVTEVTSPAPDQDKENCIPPGQVDRDKPVPPGQDRDRCVPPGQAKDKDTPPGQDKDKDKDKDTPPGQDKDKDKDKDND